MDTTEEVNAFLTSFIKEQNAYQKELADIAVKKDLGPLNEHSRSLLHAKLSTLTRRLEERRLAKLAKKKHSLRCRASVKAWSYARRRNHWAKLQATKRRARARMWEKHPVNCIEHSWGVWKIDKQLWERHMKPLWGMYKPGDLTWEKAKKIETKGTKDKPHTIYSLVIKHRKLGIVFNGRDQELYDLSCPVEG